MELPCRQLAKGRQATALYSASSVQTLLFLLPHQKDCYFQQHKEARELSGIHHAKSFQQEF